MVTIPTIAAKITNLNHTPDTKLNSAFLYNFYL